MDNSEEYFFSTDHMQACKGHGEDKYPQEQGFVPITFHLPHHVVPRPEFPTGWIRTVADLVKLHFSQGKEIPNPDPSYQS